MTARRIPRVAAAALLFGGCSSDETNVDPIERDELDSSATALCTSIQTCDSYAFGMDYADLADCIDFWYSKTLGEVEDQTDRYGEACGDAGLDYFACVGESIAADCYAITQETCADELAVIDTYCGGID